MICTDRIRVGLPAAMIAAALAALPRAAWAVGTTEIIVMRGTPAPDGNGTISTGDPTLNNAGQAAFRAGLFGTSGGMNDDTGILRSDGTTLIQIAREGDPAPDGNGNFSRFSLLSFNDAGQVAFEAQLRDTRPGMADNEGIFVYDDVLGVLQVARGGDPVPDGNGDLFEIFGIRLAFNTAGQVAFFSRINLNDGGSPRDEDGLFRGDGTTLIQIVRTGDPAPDGNGIFNLGSRPVINDAGQVAFRGSLTGTSGGDSDNNGIFRHDGNMITQIAREGDAAPDGNSSFSDFISSDLAINNAGQVVFRAELTGASPQGTEDWGIFRDDGTLLVQIARTGDVAPDGNGSFAARRFSLRYALNEPGQLLFLGFLTGTSGGDSDDTGLFRGDGTTLIQIAREGDVAPDGDGSFSSFDQLALNDVGQAAFFATLADTSDDEGIFFYDDLLGLLQVARKGDSFLGSTIDRLNFVGDSNITTLGDERSGLNDQGQVAFQFFLTDGRAGVALWTVPEPGTWALVLSLLGAGSLRSTRTHAR